MFTTIQGADYSAYTDNIDLEITLGDPHPQLTFQIEDIGEQFTIQDGMEVVIWDETALPVSGVETIPSNNMLVDPTFDAVSGGADAYYAKGGDYPSNVSFTLNAATITFTNQDGEALFTQATQQSYYTYVAPGQQYMLSAYVKGNSAVNFNYYVQMNWLDSAGNYMSNVYAGFTAPPSTRTRVSCSGVAPTGASYIQVQIGAITTVAGTNSGNVVYDTLQLEPVLFPGQAMADLTAITYPTPDLNYHKANCTILPDGTYSRLCRLFTGYISYHERTYIGHDRYVQVTCKPLGDIIENGSATGDLINVSYTGQTDNFIINDIVTNYFSGLLTTGQMNSSAPPTTIFTGLTIDAMTHPDKTFREVVNNLSDLSGYSFFVDPYGYLHYNDTPFDYAPFSVSRDSAPDNVTIFAPQEYKYVSDSTQLRNAVKVVGGEFEAEYQETFSGDGVTKNFNLSFVPTKIALIAIGGTTLAPTSANHIGIAGQDINGVSGIVALMDAANPVSGGGPRVVFNTAPVTGTSNVVITYTTPKNVSVRSVLPTSLAQYRRNFVSKVNDPTFVSNNSAAVRGNSEIAKYAVPLITVEMALNVFVYPGTTVYFTSSADNLVSYPFVVQKVTCKSLSNGYYRYEYEIGVYRPSFVDRFRNLHKSVARSTSRANSTPIQVIHILTEDIISSGDSATATIAIPTTAKYGSATYGFSIFN